MLIILGMDFISITLQYQDGSGSIEAHDALASEWGRKKAGFSHHESGLWKLLPLCWVPPPAPCGRPEVCVCEQVWAQLLIPSPRTCLLTCSGAQRPSSATQNSIADCAIRGYTNNLCVLLYLTAMRIGPAALSISPPLKLHMDERPQL